MIGDSYSAHAYLGRPCDLVPRVIVAICKCREIDNTRTNGQQMIAGLEITASSLHDCACMQRPVGWSKHGNIRSFARLLCLITIIDLLACGLKRTFLAAILGASSGVGHIMNIATDCGAAVADDAE